MVFNRIVDRLAGREFPVQIMTIPRSGHHFLIDRLWDYRGRDKRLGYCEFYLTRREGCCQQIPCRNPIVRMQKSHDFDGNHPMSRTLRHIVQCRPLIDTLVSEYELMIDQANLPDSMESWTSFATDKVNHRNIFVAKWLGERSARLNKIVVHYNDLLKEPHQEILRIAAFIWPEDKPKPENLPEIALREPRNARQFRYYDEAFFGRLADRLSAAQALIDSVRRY